MKYRQLIFISLFFFIINIGFSNLEYQSVRLYNPTSEKIEAISVLGIPLDHSSGKKGYYIDFITNSEQLEKLKLRDFNIEILIQNLTEYYKSRNIVEESRDFPLGSMQGNYTLNELNNRFEELQGLYPNLISEKVILGQSHEQRDIWAFKVSDNPNVNEDEPEVLYTGLTHAREPLGMMNLFYFVQKLVEQYEEDSESNYLVNNRELWFIPVVNPDGYVFNESIAPNGGGMHRKNRYNTGCGDGNSRGVDLNRNYGFGWGSDNIGSSPDGCSDTYRGDSEFSEIETQIVRDFILNNQFQNILHYHSYSNVYIHAYGDGSIPNEPDISTLNDIGNEMARYNGYGVGTGSTLIGYTVNGDAVDWTYGDQGIIAYTPEVGTPSQGFWPSENEIIDLCQDQLYPNKIFAFISGADVIIKSYDISDDLILQEEEVEIQVLIENRGLGDLEGTLEISFSPLNNWANINSEVATVEELEARSSEELSILMTISQSTPQGATTGVIINMLSENSYSRTDTVLFTVGESETFYNENFEEEFNDWDLDDNWGLTEITELGNFSLTDSPGTDYDPNQVTVAELNKAFDFSFVSNPIVKFKAKWDIELNYDFIRFQGYVTDLGWVSLEGEFTKNGTGNPAQPIGEPGYDGSQESWVDEKIYLNQLGQVNFEKFRFIQTSDQYVEGGCFLVDDFLITGYPQGQIGDFNLDAEVDIYDLLLLSDLLLFGNSPSDSQLFYSDLDMNGTLDIMDIILLTNKILNF